MPGRRTSRIDVKVNGEVRIEDFNVGCVSEENRLDAFQPRKPFRKAPRNPVYFALHARIVAGPPRTRKRNPTARFAGSRRFSSLPPNPCRSLRPMRPCLCRGTIVRP